ncbi:MAG: saccharopine dehydrogenase NADP-binding domain-containing protein, partial [Halioglobus sp.]|nr:saccharopine dehydrogenase NADP-binding domain-containing protein [Halioglobus sp.]
MSNILIVGAGGVGGVVTHKCALNSDVFSRITLASRTKSKCDRIAAEVKEMHGVEVATASVDADQVSEMAALIRDVKPDMVLNVALPY